MAFKIPLQSEVVVYIKSKMDWPQEFVNYYANRFWNHYQASGWKLSNGNAMKDWKACFNSNWQVLKFKEDIEMLNRFRPKGSLDTSVKPPSPKPSNMIEELDQLLEKYTLHPTEVPFTALSKYYEYMKAERLLKPLTSLEINDLWNVYGDNIKCRCACVQMTMDGYVKGGITFSKVMELRLKLTV